MCYVIRRSKTLRLIVVLASALIAQRSQAVEEYDQQLAQIYFNIISNANYSGGDASWFRLADSTGTVIVTDDNVSPTNIYCLKVSKGGVETGRKNILVIGNQHAREWIGYRCVLDCAKFIIDNRNVMTWPTNNQFTFFRKFKDMNLSNLTDNANIYFIPVANPSGYIYSRANDQVDGDDGWRKNRRITSSDAVCAGGFHGSTANSDIGVDLNRNWPGSDWGRTNSRPFPTIDDIMTNTQIATCRFTNEDIYCGNPVGGSWTNWPFAPNCEKEVQGIVTLFDAHNFDLVIDVHSSGRQVGWCENVDVNSVHVRSPDQGWISDKQIFKLLATKAAKLIKDPVTGYPYVPYIEYPVSGDLLWYAYEKTGNNALTFLIEAGPSGNYRPSNATAHSDAVLPGMLFMMFASIDARFDAKPTFRFRKP